MSRSAGPADEVGSASTSPNREEDVSSSAEVVPALLRELAHSPEIPSGAVGPALDAVHLPPGVCLGPYRIVARLGSGGMGVVHEAHDVRLGRRVALKFLSAELANDADARSRFRREARAASALNHPHICTIHDVGEHEGAPYLVMELLVGETLLDRLARGPLPPDEFFDVTLAVASALEAAGARGIVHRDLKPANVFLTRSGGAKVLDFGLARIGEAGDASQTQTSASRRGEPTRAGAMMGTLHYMSPEQVRGEPVDARTDLFSFGVVLYEMVAGRRPFDARTAGLIADAILHLDPVPPDVERLGFPPGLAGVIGRALEKDLRRRYQTAADLGADLLRVRVAPGSRPAGIAAPAMPVPPSSFVGRVAELAVVKRRQREGEGSWTRLTRRKVALALIPLLLVVGGGIFWRHEYATAPPSGRAPLVAGTTADPGLSMARPSLAVLPFESLGGSSENSYFADGMTDDIITDLSKLSGILIISRNSSRTYKGKSVKVQQVATELGVRYVLQGSVRREGDTVRINAQLVDALGGQHLWAERYDGSIRDVFALQDKVIGQIVAALAVKLTHDERTRLELVETGSPQAYDAVLRGWAHYRQGSQDETRKAITLFEQAIALDPGYARAHAALAAASWRIVLYFWESTTQGGYQRAFDRMQAALGEAMRQPNALAHAVSAEVLSKQGNYEETFAEIGKAMALAPNDPDIYLSKARILNATGHAAQAEESVRWAMRLDPVYSPEYRRTLAMSLFNQQRYEEAVGTLERLLAEKSDVPDDYSTLIASLGHLGRKSGIPEAIKTCNELSVSAGYNTITVQMFGGWWWYGDIFNYDPAYRYRLMEGLRKAGVPEGAGTDIPFEKYRALLRMSGGYYEVTGATTIDHEQAKTLHDHHVKFVDVRAAKGFASGHVPGAFNLDIATELSRDSLSRIVSKDEELVLSCHGKTCAESAYASAKALIWGFKRVDYFAGGFPAWEEAGYPVEVSPAK